MDGSPICFTGIPEELIAKATPVSRQLPPWPGDPGRYAGTRSVEIDSTKQPAEHGLHTRAVSPVTSKCTTCDHFKVHHRGWVFSDALRGALARS
jgi:hypothetical protein